MADLVDFKYYTESFSGPAMDQREFNNALKWATAQVNQLTFGRIQKLTTVPVCVKDAICAAIQKYVEYNATLLKSNIASESNDGYSISYAKPVSENEMLNNVRREIKMYLSGTDLMYLGGLKNYDA